MVQLIGIIVGVYVLTRCMEIIFTMPDQGAGTFFTRIFAGAAFVITLASLGGILIGFGGKPGL